MLPTTDPRALGGSAPPKAALSALRPVSLQQAAIFNDLTRQQGTDNTWPVLSQCPTNHENGKLAVQEEVTHRYREQLLTTEACQIFWKIKPLLSQEESIPHFVDSPV